MDDTSRKLKVAVISPTRVGFEGTGDSIVVPAYDGLMDILIWFGPTGSIQPTPVPVAGDRFGASCHPNPFNPVTKIFFALPQRGQVGLVIYNTAGRRVKVLVSEEMESGLHSILWNGENQQGRRVASGVYYYRLVAEGFEQTPAGVVHAGRRHQVRAGAEGGAVRTRSPPPPVSCLWICRNRF